MEKIFKKYNPGKTLARSPKKCDLARSARKFAVFRGEIGREAPKNLDLIRARSARKIGVLSVLKGKTVKRWGREAPENLRYIKNLVTKNLPRF